MPGASSRPEPHDDLELLEAVRRRDESALRALFGRYAGRVHGFVRGRVGDPGLAEEITTDVFFEVWRGAERFRGESRVSSWIFGIAHFKCLVALRERRAAKRSRLAPASESELLAVADPQADEDRLIARAELARVRALLAAMPESQQRIVELALIEGLSHEEIGRELGIDPENVRARVFRARARLRALGARGGSE
jgi:RNA polymerase sigma-70 factor (ECF subfamily)